MERPAIISKLLSFLDASPSPYHAVDHIKRQLISAGFLHLQETTNWATNPKLSQGGKYFFTRNGSALVAFAVGGNFDVSKGGANIIAAHTDSPCLKVKPVSKRKSKDGVLQVAVETYGGGLWHTWFDRDLGLAGRIVSGKQDLNGESLGIIQEHLIKVDRPVLRIPTLAIHLDGSVREGFKFNTELQLNPVLATNFFDAKQTEGEQAANDGESSHHPALLKILRQQCKHIGTEEILASDLCLFDCQKAAIGGVHDEFVHSGRLDNLMLSFCAIESLLNSVESLESDENVRMVVLFDNEEVGSESAHGAMSTLVQSTLERIVGSFGQSSPARLYEFISQSFLISADMAHAVHPNYSDKHDECHRPEMHKGVVIKYNSNQRYCTSSRSAAYLKGLARKLDVPLQEFMVRNDGPCGSTIGPIVSAKLGIAALDIGLAQWSMHSIRETAGVNDVGLAIKLLSGFFEQSPNKAFRIHSLDSK